MLRSSHSAFRRSSRRLAAGLCTAVVASSLAVAASTSVQAAASIEVVKQSSLGNWLLGPEGVAGGSHEFVAGPGSAPIGAGSLQMSLTNANQGYVAALPNAVPGQTRFDAMQTLSYSTYRSAGSSAAWQTALQFNVDYDVTDASDVWQGRLVYEPYNTFGDTLAGQWYTWDALDANGRWWGTGVPVVNNGAVAQPCTQGSLCTRAQLLDAFPNVGFRGTGNVLLLKAGSNWNGFVGSVDNLDIQVGGNQTTYDFEPETQCSTTCYVDGATGNNAFGGDSPASAKATIQAAVTQVDAGGMVIVNDGTYVENVSINKALTLESTNGRDVTTIAGIPGVGALGTVRVAGGPDGLVIGGDGKGFRIEGIDNGAPGLENAAVYFQGSHANSQVLGNEIVANGDGGLVTEFGAVVTGLVIDGNIFSGQTFLGPNPAGNGFGDQFSLANVPRQLVTVGGGSGGGNTSNTTFTNNVVTGSAGGFTADVVPNEQGNTLVTIDSNGALIEGNTFAGTTARFATQLRARGGNTVIQYNVFDSSNLIGVGTGHVFVQNAGTEVNRNDLSGATRGVLVGGAAPVDATCNWWGAADGPSGVGAGSGSTVEGILAVFDPWLSSADLNGPCPYVVARDQKQAVIDELAGLLPTGDNKADKEIERAIKAIEKSIDPKFWADDDTPEKDKVFNEERKAVQALGKALETEPAVADAIDTLVAIDRQFAVNAIAAAAGGDQKRLDKADEALAKGDAEEAAGNFDKAINEYKKAWKEANKA